MVEHNKNKMQLFQMLAFNGRPVVIQNGWRFSPDGTLLIQGPDGHENEFSMLNIHPNMDSRPTLVLDGNVCTDGNHGTIRPDKKKMKNKEMALLLIVAEGDIELPEHLYHDHRVRIDPIANKDGTLVATIICFLKSENLVFGIANEFGKRKISFKYDNTLRFPSAVDGNPGTKKGRWGNLIYHLRKTIRKSICNYFHSFRPWKV